MWKNFIYIIKDMIVVLPYQIRKKEKVSKLTQLVKDYKWDCVMCNILTTNKSLTYTVALFSSSLCRPEILYQPIPFYIK